jgi:predicted alpha/beta-fold hydrolase
MESLRTWPYRRYVVERLIAQATALAEARSQGRGGTVGGRFDLGALRRIRTVREYDALVIVPEHGFRDTDDYYARASCGPGLSRIEVPTLVVHAADDPMVPGDLVAPDLPSRARAVEVAWSTRGGHVGWVNDPLSMKRGWLRTWAMDQTARFIERIGTAE